VQPAALKRASTATVASRHFFIGIAPCPESVNAT